MAKNKMVAVSSFAFLFCRYSITILVWLAFILKIKWIIAVVFFIMIFSAILKIGRAPMIVLYNLTLGRLFKSSQEILDEKAMRFAHATGSVLGLVCLIFLYFVNEKVGWAVVFIFALVKTISALGFCPAAKLYGCAIGGSHCCAFLKKK